MLQNLYRVMVRPCLGRRIFTRYAKAKFKLHQARDPEALAEFNRSIQGLTFPCKISTWQTPDGGDALITAFSID